METENRAFFWTILYTIYKSICFVCVNEMSQGDVTFTRTKHRFDREKTTDSNHFWGAIYSYAYLPIIRTFDILK